MIIKHNTAAINANRQLGLITEQLSKTTEKLSSGYQINRAADDAAGLSISEKMRRQIRGLTQASDNIEDGISLCQVADGALNETVDILQRMRVLAVQSANGIYTEHDRQSIDLEFAQLKSEVDRIAETTNFNGAVYPLNSPMEITDIPFENSGDGLIREKTVTIITDKICIYGGVSYNIGDTITLAGLTTNDTEAWFLGGDPSSSGGRWVAGNFYHTNVSEPLAPLRISDLNADENGYLYYTHRSGTRLYAIYADSTSASNPDPLQFNIFADATRLVTSGGHRFMTIDDLGNQKTDKKTSYPAYDVIIQAGADSGELIPIHTVNATCKALGIAGLTVATHESSGEAMTLLNGAISKVTTYRSVFGVTQNRLECAKRVDDNTAENTQAAESRIRDTDISAAMVIYANANILMQAGQSMLSQANQSKQDVARLLEFS